MHDDNYVELIDDAFAAFRTGAPLAPPIGADAARATVRHRRRVRTVAAAGLAALAVIAAVTLYATGFIRATGPPVVGTSVEPSASTAPPSPSAVPSAPDGRVTADQLAHATVDFGTASAGPTLCPTGRFTLNGNPTMRSFPASSAETISISKVVDVDFDHDGALESVALITCAVQGHDNVVLALDRSAAGEVRTVGKVVATSEQAPIKTVFDVRADPDGAIGVQVGDSGTCCGMTEDMVEHQWRGYTFDGQGFRQSGGPTRFTPKPTPNDLTVTATGLTFGPPSGGVRRGSVTVSVHNNGPNTAPGAVVDVSITSEQGFPAKIEIGTDLNDCKTEAFVGGTGQTIGWHVACHLFSFAKGATRSYTFRFTSPVTNDATFRADATRQFKQVWSSATVTEEQPNVRTLPEGDASNNSVSTAVTLAG
jgi:hypothetical protein